MKRIMGIIGLVIMSLAILLPSTNVYAMSSLQSMIKNDPSLKPLVKVLREKGVPDDYIVSKLPYKRDMLESMSKIDGKFIKHEAKSTIMEQSETNAPNDTVSPHSAIPSSELLIDVTYWSRSDSSHPTHKDTYTFYADYDWVGGNPTWVLTDIFGMAWGGNFTIESNSILCVASFIDAWGYSTRTTATRSTVSTSGGFAYEIDIIGDYMGEPTEKNLGWISADVYHYPDTTGSANIVADYYHKKITPGLPGIVIDKTGPKVTLSSYTNIDSANDYTAIDY